MFSTLKGICKVRVTEDKLFPVMLAWCGGTLMPTAADIILRSVADNVLHVLVASAVLCAGYYQLHLLTK